jgi:hypothetical protein
MAGLEVDDHMHPDGSLSMVLLHRKQRRQSSGEKVSYPIFITKLSTHRVHDPGSNVPYIRPKVLTDNQMP